ncbi:hypothetical protein [Novosphingobium sp. SG720]|uniref:hypothetical protein n=1 Tax=Novosphingobium sp. SG720 TaxID=2586998 RepID=UPI00144812C3|nr:hypothetical protein [Novosphingobium sp. SG720]NKJ41161.1 MFS family permease [Novosphingobium sp. SG720]
MILLVTHVTDDPMARLHAAVVVRHSSPDDCGASDARAAWLQSSWLWLVAMVLTAVPLVLPPVAPLTDLGGHLGHYAVQLDHGRSADLARWYSFRWNLVPNLGVDLLMEALAPLLGLEPALRLVAAAIPMLQVLGILCLARAVQGRITPLALFALPLAYCYPLHFGFLNFVLGQALATLALALWIAMGRRGWIAARWALFVPLSSLLWACHLVAWAMLCVFAGMDELARRWRPGQWWDWRVLLRAGLAASCLVAPQILRLLVPLPPSGHGATEDFFNPAMKLTYLLMPLRDRWLVWDVAGAAILLALVGWSIRRRASGILTGPSRGLWWAIALLCVVYLLLPATLIGASLVDMRLVPLVLIVALVVARPRYAAGGALSWAGLARWGAAFAMARILGNALSLWLAGHELAADLVALDSVPRGSRVASLVVEPCVVSILPWQRERRTHLGGYAIARRHAFSNEQWMVPGGHLLKVNAPLAGAFATDDSEFAKLDSCDKPNTISRRLAALPHDAFDYIWILDTDRVRAVAGAVPVRRTRASVLYRIITPPRAIYKFST